MKSSIILSSQPRSIAVGDVNNDHQMDIIVPNSGTNMIGIFLSKGDGTVADFNRDNYLDIAVANYGIKSIDIFLGNGNKTFTDQTLFSLGSSRPLFIAIGDFNSDNRTDIVASNYGTNNIGILLVISYKRTTKNRSS